jgi:hypothetical protein
MVEYVIIVTNIKIDLTKVIGIYTENIKEPVSKIYSKVNRNPENNPFN